MHDFEDTIYGQCIYMGNSMIARFTGKGKIFLKFTCSKVLPLNNVFYVFFLRRNLILGILLNEAEMKTIIGDDKHIISCNEVVNRKEYLNGSLFVLDLAFETTNENAYSSTYITKSIDLWHGRLAHVTFASIK